MVGIKHRSVSKHVWHLEEAHVRTSNKDLVQVIRLPISRGHCDVFELNIHVIFTFKQFPTIYISGVQLHGYYVALRLVQQ